MGRLDFKSSVRRGDPTVGVFDSHTPPPNISKNLPALQRMGVPVLFFAWIVSTSFETIYCQLQAIIILSWYQCNLMHIPLMCHIRDYFAYFIKSKSRLF